MGFMYSGGGERTAIYECILLERRGHDVTCFVPAARRDLCYPELIKEIKLKTFLPRVRMRLPMRDFLSMMLSSFLALSFAQRFSEFDVILCHGQPAIWIAYCVARSAKVPYACYLHQPARFIYPRSVDLEVGWKTKRDFALLDHLVGLSGPFAESFDHVSVASARRVLVNSRWILSQVSTIYGLDPVLCPPGVDDTRFKPVSKKTDLEVGGMQVKKPFVLSTNRHYPQKGMALLIKMMPKILKEFDITLVVTGHFTGYTRNLMALANDLGVRNKVVFTGLVSEADLARLYQNADVYAYMSPCEDFGLGPIEAMACGTPSVTWDYAGPAETMVDGVTGFKVARYDLDDFAKKVLILLKDEELNLKMSSSAASYVREHFSWTRHVEILEHALKDLTQ